MSPRLFEKKSKLERRKCISSGIAHHYSVGFMHFLNHLSVVVQFVFAQKIVNHKSDCFARSLLIFV
jgi:hypothetical protein